MLPGRYASRQIPPGQRGDVPSFNKPPRLNCSRPISLLELPAPASNFKVPIVKSDEDVASRQRPVARGADRLRPLRANYEIITLHGQRKIVGNGC